MTVAWWVLAALAETVVRQLTDTPGCAGGGPYRLHEAGHLKPENYLSAERQLRICED